MRITDFFRCTVQLIYKLKQVGRVICKQNYALETWDEFMFVFKNP